MWHMGDGWGWWMAFGWVGMALVMALIVWAVYAVLSRPERKPADWVPRDEGTALAILERRYARGELTAEQFEEMRARLPTSSGPTSRAA